MNMTGMRRIVITALAYLTLLAALCACSSAPADEPTPQPTSVPTAAPTAAPTPVPEPTPDPDSPEGRAAALGLPAPPDVDITSWMYLVANSYNLLLEYYPQMRYVHSAMIDSRIYDDTMAMLEDAIDAGHSYCAIVGMRYFEEFKYKYQDKILELGSAAKAAEEVFAPGTSDHHTALAIDISMRFDNIKPLEGEDLEWLREHAAEYGFILRYPEGKEEYYGVACTNGTHLRYVGHEAAEYIAENGLCLEEFVRLYDKTLSFIPSDIYDE